MTAGTGRKGDGEQPSAPATRTPLSEVARQAVRDRIIDGSYAQGTRVVEREIAQDLQMSRVPVREALRALVEEGLLDLLPHSGVRVRRLERADVEYLYDVWEPLAIQASRLAARRVALSAPGGHGALAELRAVLERAEAAASAGDRTRENGAGTAFHEGIVALADNPLLAQLMQRLNGQLRLLFGLNTEPAPMRAQHGEMYERIAAGDADAAAAITLLHVRKSRELALRAVTETGPDVGRSTEV
ncbi:GntR family transcriptional regulator [Streptomyces sp. NBC_00378]|uniref:GntR family transcriptional regulator n=1 Tax=unclassified Streptomyces TaxID=2593676 RepID=UPI002258B76F|nr:MULTISPECIES: GntR family transcriptional regulator [unclassified Streptomyces]MCX5115008.1 GntR family transcriptional regulator [Streptomyces sp. NBC_00378]